MDVKEFLRRIRTEQTELELMLLKKNNMIYIRALTFDKDKINTSVSEDLSEMAIKNNALLLAIDRKIRQLQKNQLRAYKMINGLEDDNQRQIMLMYYLTRKESENSEITSPYSLDEVAEALNFSNSYVKHLHGDALNVLREMKKPYKTKKALA